MFRDSSGRSYQKQKKIRKKCFVKNIKMFMKKKIRIKRYKNLLEDEKQRLAEYRKVYYKVQNVTARLFNKKNKMQQFYANQFQFLAIAVDKNEKSSSTSLSV